MNKSERLSLVILGVILAGFVILGGWGCSESESRDNENIVKGKAFLAEGKGDDARDIFTAELNRDPDNCNGLYGRILADFQSLLKMTNDVLATGSGLMVAGFGPKMNVDAYEYIRDFLSPFQKVFLEMDADVDRVAELDCTFYTDSYLLALNASDNEPIADMVLTGEWSKAEALLIGGQIHIIMGVINYISSHNLILDINSLIGLIQNGYPEGSRLIYMARSLGQFMQDNPYFLTKSENRWNLQDEARRELIEGLSEDAAVLEAVEGQKSDPADSIFGFTDLDGNGFDAGDELNLGIKQLSVSGGTTLLGRVRFLVPDYFSREAVLELKGVLDKAGTALAAVEQGGESEQISLADLNPVFSAFCGEVASSMPFVRMPPLPDVIRLDLETFFTNPRPVRDFLPVIEEIRNGVYEFMLEGEAALDGSCGSSCMADGMTITVGDTGHFSGGYQIPADCITVAEGGIANPIPYIAFSNPNFNGLLWINLDPISDNVGSCPADPAGYLPADRYSLNKLIAGLLITVTNIPEFGISF